MILPDGPVWHDEVIYKMIQMAEPCALIGIIESKRFTIQGGKMPPRHNSDLLRVTCIMTVFADDPSVLCSDILFENIISISKFYGNEILNIL